MKISEKLADLNLISGKEGGKTAAVFDKIYEDILEIEIAKESDFVTEMWGR